MYCVVLVYNRNKRKITEIKNSSNNYRNHFVMSTKINKIVHPRNLNNSYVSEISFELR